MAIYALVDCNNFFVSCERVFNPRLEGKPVIVLSSNDGCIISRSNEAKKLNIPMGAPYYQWRTFCHQQRVHVFSSNFELYGDMSDRVMTLLTNCCPEIEIYSIDEAFLALTPSATTSIFDQVTHIRKNIKTWTGIPVSIGIAPTKTLAKIANHVAKKQTAIGVFDLCAAKQRDIILSQFPVAEIWGIGKKTTQHLQKLGIYTAKMLRDADATWLRSKFSVTMARIIQELRGNACLSIEAVQPHKQIMSSRSFGIPVTALTDLEEALSSYVASACIKLRKQKNLAAGIYVFLHTRWFSQQDAQYAQAASHYFPQATADTREIIQAAKQCLAHLYKPGYRYHKTGVILLDLSPAHQQQQDLFIAHNEKNDLLMQAVDQINQKMGKHTVFYCAEGIAQPWKKRCDHRSPRYTTCWEELVSVE
ncbi:MAG TPA: Y-family DNA polymerase [Gammaproteobacteria bacterium]|nr:Y-family DNA polymerase [Gammaproteobacteria bacterium]